MKNKKPEKMDKDSCRCFTGEQGSGQYHSCYCDSYNEGYEEIDEYYKELLAGLKKVHEMGLIKGDWSDQQCDNFIKALFKETQEIANELGWDNEK